MFYFINFFCANLLFVFLILYPIKRLTKGVTVIEQLPTYKFKFVLIVASILIFIYILVVFLINIVSKLKNTIFSDKGIMDSLLMEMMEKKKDKDNNVATNGVQFIDNIKRQNLFI